MTSCSSSPFRPLHVMLLVMALVLAGTVLFSSGAPVAAQSSSTARSSSASIRTPDFEESVRWYQDNLGFRLVGSQNFVQGRTAVLERSGFLLEITEVDHLLQPFHDPHATGGVEVTRTPVISLFVPDVDAEIERLSQAGVEVLQSPEDELDGRFRTAQIRDNGRHRIELRESLDEGDQFNRMGR